MVLIVCCCLGGFIAAATQYFGRTERFCVYHGDDGECGSRFAGPVTPAGISLGVGIGAVVWAVPMAAAQVRRRKIQRGSTPKEQ